MAAFNLLTHNGIITARSPKTGDHRTFRISTQPGDAKFAPGRRVVSLLVGPDNRADYQPFAFVTEQGYVLVWRRYETGVHSRLADVLNRADQYEQLGVVFNFEGHCRKCNKLLTTPDSVARGLGPVCQQRI